MKLYSSFSSLIYKCLYSGQPWFPSLSVFSFHQTQNCFNILLIRIWGLKSDLQKVLCQAQLKMIIFLGTHFVTWSVKPGIPWSIEKHCIPAQTWGSNSGGDEETWGCREGNPVYNCSYHPMLPKESHQKLASETHSESVVISCAYFQFSFFSCIIEKMYIVLNWFCGFNWPQLILVSSFPVARWSCLISALWFPPPTEWIFSSNCVQTTERVS